MTYIKLFIDTAKKQNRTVGQITDPKLEKRIRKIFKEPLEDLFDQPELVRQNFDFYYNYSLDYYNTLVSKGIKPGTEEINLVLDLVVQADKNDEPEYYKNLFLLEFLGCKLEEVDKGT